MCQYDCQYMKPTRFLIWGVPPFQLPRCCPKQGRCSATGKRHVLLSGTTSSGFRTSAAQVYPWKLAEILMSHFVKVALPAHP